jgi:hypothetical protein
MPSTMGSDYDFIHDLKDFDITKSSVDLPQFSAQGYNFYICVKKNERGPQRSGYRYGCYLHAVNSYAISPGSIHFRFDLVKKLDNRVVKSSECEKVFYKSGSGFGPPNWISPATILDHVLKVKICKNFSDFVVKPFSFEAHKSFLFEKTRSNFSFKVGDEVVYAIYGILTERSDYFRAMLEGSFKEAHVPMTVDAEIPILGVDADVFKMIIEWIYTMDIRILNGRSSTILVDLERVYVAADMYQVNDLCASIIKYLRSLVNLQTFGEIYGIAKRISSKPY